jgi:hypothetical protein
MQVPVVVLKNSDSTCALQKTIIAGNGKGTGGVFCGNNMQRLCPSLPRPAAPVVYIALASMYIDDILATQGVIR